MESITTILRNKRLIKHYCELKASNVGDEKALHYCYKKFNLHFDTINKILKNNPKMLAKAKYKLLGCPVKLQHGKK